MSFMQKHIFNYARINKGGTLYEKYMYLSHDYDHIAAFMTKHHGYNWHDSFNEQKVGETGEGETICVLIKKSNPILNKVK